MLAVIVIAVAIPASMMLINQEPANVEPVPGPYDDFMLLFSGDTLPENVSVSYADLNGSRFPRHDVPVMTRNTFGTDNTFIASGVRLVDLIDGLEIQHGNANGIRFIATDGFESPFLPLDLVLENPELVIVYNAMDGEYLEGEDENGDGPLRVVMNWSVLAPVPNDPFHAKWLERVEFVEMPTVDLTIFSDGILDHNVTIPLAMLQTAWNFFVPSLDGEYTLNASGTIATNQYRGALLWGLVNRTAGLIHLDSYTGWTHLRFVNSTFDGEWIQKDSISGDTTRSQFIVAWERDGIQLGSMTGIVNNTVHDPNDVYWVENITGIELGNP